jgi:hypothetical protein
MNTLVLQNHSAAAGKQTIVSLDLRNTHGMRNEISAS